MAVESATYISELNPTYPAETEAVADGDEHFRLIKEVLQNTFPGRTAPDGSYFGISGASVDLDADHRGKFVELLQATSATLPKLGSDFYAYNYLVHSVLACTLAGTGGDLVNGAASLNMAAGFQYRILGNSATGWKVFRVGGEFTVGTRMPFAQAAAPVGWTQDTSDNANNRMLRVVSSAGGGVAGSHSPILNNVVPSHTHGFSTGTESVGHSHTTTTGEQSTNHSHAVSDPGHAHNFTAYSAGYGFDSGGGGSPLVYTGGPYSGYLWAAATGISLGIESASHYHAGTSSDASAAHTHSGSTDNGSSQTNWTPRYIDMIICTKN